MIRFAVVLFFFVHLVILMKLPQFKWLGRALGGGISMLFFVLYALSIEENSDIVFLLCGTLSALSVLGAELVAGKIRD